ncbi:hypothetical protein GCM10029992_42340 [Glycomyces albus]
MPKPPSQGVREAFAAVGEPHLLDGGQGETWRVGAVVLKPAGLAAEVRWRASTLDALPDTDRVRIGRPVCGLRRLAAASGLRTRRENGPRPR